MEYCYDCGVVLLASTRVVFGLGTKRCRTCADTFQGTIRAKRQAEDAVAKCDNCGVATGNSCYSVCKKCCEHEYDLDEGYMCLSCGDEGIDGLADAAEWALRGER